MRKTPALLAAVGLVLAAGASYYWLGQRDPRPAVATTPATAAPATAPNEDATAPTAVAPGTTSPRPRPDAPDFDDSTAQARATEAEALRAELDDPGIRAKLLERTMDTYSTDTRGGFTHFVRLSDDEYVRLMNLLTDQQLAMLEASYQCLLKPLCDPMSVSAALSPENDRAVRELLGAERQQRLSDFTDNQLVRNTVLNLRETLAKSQPLSDAQMDNLVEALGDERRRVLAEIAQQGTMPSNSFSPQGSIVIPLTAESVDRKYEEAQAYQRRLSRRAAEILNPAQLRVFNQNQAEWLEQSRRRWEAEAAAPKAR